MRIGLAVRFRIAGGVPKRPSVGRRSLGCTAAYSLSGGCGVDRLTRRLLPAAFFANPGEALFIGGVDACFLGHIAGAD